MRRSKRFILLTFSVFLVLACHSAPIRDSKTNRNEFRLSFYKFSKHLTKVTYHFKNMFYLCAQII